MLQERSHHAQAVADVYLISTQLIKLLSHDTNPFQVSAFKKNFSVRLLSVLRGHSVFFIPATTANDHGLRRIFYPRFYPLHLFSCNQCKRTKNKTSENTG